MTGRFDIVYSLKVAPSSVRSEGLNVLLSDLIISLCNLDADVVVHTTERHVAMAREGFDANGVDLDRVQFKAYPVGSLYLRWFFSRGKRKPKVPRRRGLLSRIKRWPMRVINFAFRTFLPWLLDITAANAVYKIGAVLLGLIAALLLAALLLPLGVLGAILGVAVFGFTRLMRRASASLRRGRVPMRAQLRKILSVYRATRREMIDLLYEREQMRLAARINRSRKVVTVFAPWAFEGALIAALKKRCVVVFPDIVPALYPTRYPAMMSARAVNALSLSVASADGIICYSNFVRDQQLLRFFAPLTEDKQVRVIPQGYFTPPKDEKLQDRSYVVQSLNRQRFRVVNRFPNILESAPQLHFGSFDYILYPSVDRPHKNTLTLVRAFVRLLREEYRNLKLILTTAYISDDLRNIINEERLQYDVIFMPSVPVATLNLLCAGAALMVHPSLAEGGDVFNFSRAVSHGCPALLADVAVVREMFERDGVPRDSYEPWVFDPVNAAVLQERMRFALDHRTETLAHQATVLRHLSRYTFDDMAGRYLQFMHEVTQSGK